MDKALVEAFEATDYLVCLDPAAWATIRVRQPLPESLQALVGNRPWGFVTAWNPHAQTRPWRANLAAQAGLLAALRALPETASVHPGIGIGAGGWHEPSLFAVGPDTPQLDSLANRYEQSAYVHGRGGEIARLRLLHR
ncbi:hypothetical protein ASG87_00560 [Frateuria sp. Soil773]|uniref:DUF3293 domain-containing protein n=1 Tax=Frateuria sp. Soil773 TaxID=1736407 RepID=UPI0006F3BD7F|nr:DUF3293 domain-containing protein [Frateuria sp. Soil773]KRE92444.1 hypothetical protein ASG87_00560 [Frateuria sp. Soil773]